MLQQKRRHNSGEEKPLTIHRRPERQADQTGCGRIRLKRSLDVPLVVQFVKAAPYRLWAGFSITSYSLVSLTFDTFVYLFGRMFWHSLHGRR
ncbi:MAG TPA: hypothetical protein VJ828_06350 [Lacipirellulaceae bacterium]|nr:hypothetical protein [Lacipirellulaceae bacterium]